MKRIALITGATSGFGEAIARRLAAEQYDLILTGRRQERLEALKTELETNGDTQVLTLCFDVRSYEEVEKNLAHLPGEWKQVYALINNAGLAVGLAPIHQGNVDDWERMIDTNVKGLLYVTRMISPGMAERCSGHIINIGSIAGREVYPNGNVYCTTKHAVRALSQAMRLELVPYGIRTTLIAPGAADTEFSLVRFKGDSQRADSVYQGFEPLTAQDIADTVSYVLSAPGHVDLQDILIMPAAQASATVFHKE